MYPHDIIFKLNDSEKLVVDLNIPFETLPCFCQITISFYEKEQEYILTLDDSLEDSIRRLRDALDKCLRNQFHLHTSLTKDVGYLSNECLKYALNEDEETWQLNPDLIYDKNEIWVGYSYQLWACGQWAAWMYNDKNGATIFEITPRYPGFFAEKAEFSAMPSYEEWMQSYHVAVLKTIPKKIAQQWLEQADKMLDHMKQEFDRKSQINHSKLK